MILNMLILLFVLVITELAVEGLASDLATDGFIKCSIKDLHLDNCVLKALNSFRVDENTQNKPALSEPFVIPTFHIVQESTMVNYTSTCRNSTFRGLDSFEVKNIRFDPATMTFHGVVEYDLIAVNTEYEIEGNLLAIPISGKGIANAALGSINATVEVNGKLVKHKDGGDYYSPTGLIIRMKMDDMGVNFEGLFGDNKELALMTNAALNANSKMLAEAITPGLEKIGENGFLKSIKLIAKKVLY